ncbi:MAG: GntR family transcriptional regulator, partial [Beijerinckiaceae bacterium]
MRRAPYQAIMDAIRTDIAAGRLLPGDRIPSENELVAAHGVSRMTANRAVRELAAEGLVKRAPGSGSFVSGRPLELSLLRVPDIADEITGGGGDYAARVVERGPVAASPELAQALEIAHGATTLRTLIVHLASGRPLQLEERHVN